MSFETGNEAFVHPQDLGMATLDLIEQTIEFAEEFQQLDALGLVSESYLAAAEQESRQSQQTINACLRDLGGLALEIEDSQTGTSELHTLHSWAGIDPEDGSLAWRSKALPDSAAITTDGTAIADLRTAVIDKFPR